MNEIVAAHGLRVGNVFHAGDGNLHPNILYDPRKPGEEARVVAAGAEIMKVCAEVGGSISGEHGIGLEKADFMPFIFSAADLAFMQRLKSAFNPTGLCNPGKVFPTKKSCGEVGPGRLSAARDRRTGPRPALLSAGVAASCRRAARHAPRDRRRRPRADRRRALALRRRGPHARRRGLPRLADEVARRRARWPRRPARRSCRGAAAPPSSVGMPPPRAGARPRPAPARPAPRARARRSDRDGRGGHDARARLQTALRARGQWLSLDPADAERATVGGVLAANASGPRRHLYGTVRDLLIGLTVVTAEGAVVRGGGKVVKNVAGYDLPKLFVGSHGHAGRHRRGDLQAAPAAGRRAAASPSASIA